MMDSHAQHEDQEDEIEEHDFSFYVVDYPAIKSKLHAAYDSCGVWEHAAEPGRVGYCPNDADVSVRGPRSAIERFKDWLLESGILEEP